MSENRLKDYEVRFKGGMAPICFLHHKSDVEAFQKIAKMLDVKFPLNFKELEQRGIESIVRKPNVYLYPFPCIEKAHR